MQEKKLSLTFALKKIFLSLCSFFLFYLLMLVSFCLTPTSSLAYYEEPWGKDQGLVHASLKKDSKKPKKSTSVASKMANAVIVFHQKVLSPTNGTRSHFRPSSSRYMQLAIQRYGFLRGYLMGCDRLLRENGEEWVYRTVKSAGGAYKYDPAVVDKFTK